MTFLELLQKGVVIGFELGTREVALIPEVVPIEVASDSGHE